MKKLEWKTKLVISFIIIDILIYFVHYIIFKDFTYILKTLIAQLGFLLINVLLVSIVINKLITKRQKQELINKLNMVIGIFFTEVGTYLLSLMKSYKKEIQYRKIDLKITESWTDENFIKVADDVKNCKLNFNIDCNELDELKKFLVGKRSFLLSLLQNPNLMEHEKFTDLLWAIFHLTDELANRNKVDCLSCKDIEHMEKDISRVYNRLILEWIFYMKHLKKEYPFLYSLAIRTNPFNENMKVEFD